MAKYVVVSSKRLMSMLKRFASARGPAFPKEILAESKKLAKTAGVPAEKRVVSKNNWEELKKILDQESESSFLAGSMNASVPKAKTPRKYGAGSRGGRSYLQKGKSENPDFESGDEYLRQKQSEEGY